MTLTVTATPTSGQAPLAVTYNYTVTNDSSTNAPISGATITDDKCATPMLTGGDANGNGLLDVGESWTFTCTRTFTSGGTFTSTATATGTNTGDNRTVASPPAQATVTVAAPSRSAVLGKKLPSINSRQARRNAPCISTPKRLSMRARELTLVRVRVREDGRGVGGALVRISGPGFEKRKTTNAEGAVAVRVRPKRSGTLVIQSDRCSGADRVAVLRAPA